MKIALRSMANGKIVCAENNGAQPLIANRDHPGPWETFEVIVLESDEPIPQPGQPGIPQPEPPGPMPEMSAQYVAAVKRQLEAQGVNLVGPCGAFKITQRVAWGLRGVGIGLVAKPGGNNCEGYSVDYLCKQNGDGVDMLGDAGGKNTPQWAEKPGEFTGQNRWRPPVQP
jgi:hypothetical protein